jgi:hypothetical protein
MAKAVCLLELISMPMVTRTSGTFLAMSAVVAVAMEDGPPLKNLPKCSFQLLNRKIINPNGENIMATTQLPKFEIPFTEAPASWNTRYVTPDGFVCMITLRGESGKDLLERAAAALNWLKDNNFLPCDNVPFRPRNNRNHPASNGQSSNSDTHTNNGNGNESQQVNFCPIHQVEMRHFEKNGRAWYSHKADDGSWCNGKRKGGNNG